MLSKFIISSCLLIILFFFSFDAKSQSESDSVIAQHCVNFFGNYLLGKYPKLKNHRETNRRVNHHREKEMEVYFNWISDSSQTFIADYLINNIFKPKLNNDSIYYVNPEIKKECSPIKLEKVNNPIFVKKWKKNVYWMTVYQPKKIGEYYYVKITLSLHYQGYWIYFQVKNTEEPLGFYIQGYMN